MIRSLHLADVAMLLLFLGKSPVDEAKARCKLNDRGRKLAALFPLLRSCLVSQDTQHSCICIHGGFIQGLAALQSCRGHTAWEIERLLFIQGREDCSLDLMEGLGSTGDDIQAGRLFLRLRAGSPVIEKARQAGFRHYLTEFLYRLGDGQQVRPPEGSIIVRPKTKADEHRLFRLYTAAAPVQVRAVEGMTYEEWRQSKDRGPVKELVFEEGGEAVGWLRIRFDGKAGQFSIVGDLEASKMGDLVDYGLSAMRRSNPVYCLVPEYQPQLQRVLEEKGFQHVDELLCLSKELMARVREH
ncbi:MAG: hypothetical protein MUP21_02890, partial [Dehalococcoidia bacterium]|nr:hypothetical protein [Dehalococcoidia bacterium]